MKIDYKQLSSDALEGVLDTFIQREGTDYGDYELSCQSKRNQILHQLRNGVAVLVFDPETETVNILTSKEYSLML